MVRGTQMYDGMHHREVDMAYLLSSQIVSQPKLSRATSPERHIHREEKMVPRLSLSTDGGSVDENEITPHSEDRQNNRLLRSRRKGAKGDRRRNQQRRGSAAPQHLAALARGFGGQENVKADQQHLHFNSLADNVRVGFSILNLVRFHSNNDCITSDLHMFIYIEILNIIYI